MENGSESVNKYGTNPPPEYPASVTRNGVVLKGPTGTSIGHGLPSANVALRKQLDLYANLRPVKSLPNLKTRHEGVDLTLARENTDDLYAGVPHAIEPGVVECLTILSDPSSLRLPRFAFELARKQPSAPV